MNAAGMTCIEYFWARGVVNAPNLCHMAATVVVGKSVLNRLEPSGAGGGIECDA